MGRPIYLGRSGRATTGGRAVAPASSGSGRSSSHRVEPHLIYWSAPEKTGTGKFRVRPRNSIYVPHQEIEQQIARIFTKGLSSETLLAALAAAHE